MLLNDTANVSHVGCQAVSDAHARMLGRRGHKVVKRYFLGDLQRFADPDASSGIAGALADPVFSEEVESVDAVVVNGEGSIHHGAGSEYLNVLGAAIRLGKPALLVNCVLEAVDGFDDVLSNLDDLVVRDERSRRYLAHKGIAARLVHDSFIEARFEDHPLVNVADRVVVTDWHHARDHDVGRNLLNFLGHCEGGSSRRDFFLPFLCSDVSQVWSRVPATLFLAHALVTGRHHGVYAAALVGLPFVAFSGNTFKIEGFFDQFPELAFCLNPSSIADAVAQATERRDLFLSVRDLLLSKKPLPTFERLGGIFDPDGEKREVDRLAQDCFLRSDAFGVDLAYRLTRRSEEMQMATGQRKRS